MRALIILVALISPEFANGAAVSFDHQIVTIDPSKIGNHERSPCHFDVFDGHVFEHGCVPVGVPIDMLPAVGAPRSVTFTEIGGTKRVTCVPDNAAEGTVVLSICTYQMTICNATKADLATHWSCDHNGFPSAGSGE